MWPAPGNRSRQPSSRNRPFGVAAQRRKKTMPTTARMTSNQPCVCIILLTLISTWVKVGRSPFSSSLLKIGSKRGTKKTMRTFSTIRPVTPRNIGYARAPTTFAFRSSWCSVKSAIRLSTSSRKPPSWPARTMLTANSLNALGCWDIASARLVPSATLARTSRNTLASAGCELCRSRMSRLRSIGTPE